MSEENNKKEVTSFVWDKNAIQNCLKNKQENFEHSQEVFNLNQTDDNGNTALTWACKNDQNIAFELLKHPEIDVNKPNKYKKGISDETPPLVWACQYNPELVPEFLKHSEVVVNPKGSIFRESALLAAIKNDSGAAQALLKDSRIDPNCSNGFGDKAVITAHHKNPDLVPEIFNHPNFKAKDLNFGESLILMKYHQDEPEFVINLLSQSDIGFNEQISEKSGTLLETACQKYPEIANEMLKHQDIGINNQINSVTVLMTACEYNPQLVPKILEHKETDPNIKDYQGERALTLACKSNSEAAIELLNDSRTDTDIRDREGMTLLMIACQYNPELVPKILENPKTDPDATEPEGNQTALMIACKYNPHLIPELSKHCDLDKRNDRGSRAGRRAYHNLRHFHPEKLEQYFDILNTKKSRTKTNNDELAGKIQTQKNNKKSTPPNPD